MSFGSYNGGSGNQLFLNYTYVAGYTNTTLAAAKTVGATSITVADGTGIVVGQMLTMYDGMNTEIVTVASTYTFGSKTVPLTRSLVNVHAIGTSVSALPPAIKEAAILITTAFLKVRGDSSMTMAITAQPSMAVSGSQRFSDEMKIAADILTTYSRIR